MKFSCMCRCQWRSCLHRDGHADDRVEREHVPTGQLQLREYVRGLPPVLWSSSEDALDHYWIWWPCKFSFRFFNVYIWTVIATIVGWHVLTWCYWIAQSTAENWQSSQEVWEQHHLLQRDARPVESRGVRVKYFTIWIIQLIVSTIQVFFLP